MEKRKVLVARCRDTSLQAGPDVLTTLEAARGHEMTLVPGFGLHVIAKGGEYLLPLSSVAWMRFESEKTAEATAKPAAKAQKPT